MLIPPIKKAIVQISSAQILALNATPVQLVPAPGVGKIVIADRFIFKIVRTATAYANGGVIEFRYTNAAGALVAATIAAAVITGGAGTEFNTVGGVVSTLTPVANAAIVVDNATAAFITGTGVAQITVFYRVENVGV